jgi:hypothetical protein
MLKTMMCGLLFSLASMCNASPILLLENTTADVNKSYLQGESIEISVWISGLTGSYDNGGVDLGLFDINLLFDRNVTQYVDTIFSQDLDDSVFFELSAIETSGGLNFFGVSLLFDLSTQLDAFKLFSLSFIAKEIGDSDFTLNSLLLDSMGYEFTADSNKVSIKVQQPVVSVYEPNTMLLLLIGLLLVCGVRRKTFNRHPDMTLSISR